MSSLVIRLTRAQLVALVPCSSGLDLFDRLAPSGVYEATNLDDLGKVPVEFREWIGNVLPIGSGDGYGSGSGYGYEDGYEDWSQ